MEHILKTQSKYFKLVETREKSFEVRLNDRNFAVGDTIRLVEYAKYNHHPYCTGQECVRKIIYILGLSEDEKQYVPEGYVILGLE